MSCKPIPLFRLALLLVACQSFFACVEQPQTFAIHSPIFPASTETVTYSLRRVEGDAKTVRLFEVVQNVNAAGQVSGSPTEQLLRTWNSPAATDFPLTFTRSSGYGTNRFVTYRFEVVGSKQTYQHRISFATRPYPVAGQAAPVYVVGDINSVMNLVFIPDTDMAADMTTFRTAVQTDIDEVIHGEDWVRRFRSSYNFFINPDAGHAHDFDTETHDHELPANWDNLSFAQGKAILHSRSIRDFNEPDKNLFSAEHYVRGTFLHESGHCFYRLADEYPSGSHWQEATLPTNWSSLAACQADAPGRGMTTADAHQMGSSGWYKLCPTSCVMESSGTAMHPYEKPCRDRILYALLKRGSE
ncbi:hypothetical protein ACAW74_08505 [Fibrella sp. WM1]|uniref:hypothetical protein n=1 Tax=Fibrella musci TaxID=3242485 RepID=UPI003521D0C4